ncbi:unnamed protein product, partial [Rotaria magnacalcarata]
MKPIFVCLLNFSIEPLPTVAQHELGPIQRPNKLSCVPTKQSS